jgi:hypothetical protein
MRDERSKDRNEKEMERKENECCISAGVGVGDFFSRVRHCSNLNSANFWRELNSALPALAWREHSSSSLSSEIDPVT